MTLSTSAASRISPWTKVWRSEASNSSTVLGTPTGNPVTPVIKVSTNTSLARRLPDIIDFDTGPIVTGERTIAEVGEDLLGLVLQVASGEVQPRAVRLGQADFIPWKRGISL